MPLSPEQSSQEGRSPVIWPFITLFLSINAVVFTHMGNKGGALVPEEWILCAFGIIVAGLVLIWPFWLRHLARMNPPPVHLEPTEKAEILASMENIREQAALVQRRYSKIDEALLALKTQLDLAQPSGATAIPESLAGLPVEIQEISIRLDALMEGQTSQSRAQVQRIDTLESTFNAEIESLVRKIAELQQARQQLKAGMQQLEQRLGDSPRPQPATRFVRSLQRLTPKEPSAGHPADESTTEQPVATHSPLLDRALRSGGVNYSRYISEITDAHAEEPATHVEEERADEPATPPIEAQAVVEASESIEMPAEPKPVPAPGGRRRRTKPEDDSQPLLGL